jgi:hypothetical protein
MATNRTPGVYVKEIAAFPPTIEAVDTTTAVFIGCAPVPDDKMRKAIRVGSLAEFHKEFGAPPPQAMSVRVERKLRPDGMFAGNLVSWDGTRPEAPATYLHHALAQFDGGGPWRAVVYVVGDGVAPLGPEAFEAAFAALEAEADVSLLVFPDALRLSHADYGRAVASALASCARRRDRFAIVDVPDAVPGKTESVAAVAADFRDRLAAAPADLCFGAAYFPYLRTRLPLVAEDAVITLAALTGNLDPQAVARDQALQGRTLAESSLAGQDPQLYRDIRAFVARATATLPPSPAVAELYARTDRMRGVWKAPAADTLTWTDGPAVAVSDAVRDGLNIDPTGGKSVNAIRVIPGWGGTQVWGARTLAGTDIEWRYVNVRRLAIWVEQSLRRGLQTLVFAPNDAATWTVARSMVENFLSDLWRNGALQGTRPEDGFYVAVGPGVTMTAEDVLAGRMIVEVGLAALRPAEFIVLRVEQFVGSV